MPSDALFLKLAEALARPSGAYRAANAALDIPGQALGGYEAGAQFVDRQRKRRNAQMTLTETLGGRTIPGLEEFQDIRNEQIPEVAPLAPFLRAKRPGLDLATDVPVYTPEQALEKKNINPKSKIVHPSEGMGDARRANLGLREQNMALAFAKNFDADSDVKKAFVERNQSQRAKEVLAAGNPVGDSSVRVIAARAAGEVGNLAQNEQQVFGGSPALTDWLARNTQRLAQGTLDETDRQYLKQLFDVYSNYANSRLNQRKNFHATRYSKISGLPLQEASARIGDLTELGVTPELGSSQPSGIDTEAEAAIQRVMSSGVSDGQKQAMVAAIKARASSGR